MAAQHIEFKDLVNNLQIGVMRCSSSAQSKCVYVNAAFREMFGFNVKDISGLHLASIFVEHRKYQLLKKTVSEEGCVKNFEARLRGKEQKILWCSVAVVTVKDVKGKVEFFDVTLADITARKQYEREILESKELFHTVFDNTAAAITVTDKDERIIAWNPFAEKMLGMDKEGLFNKSIKDFYPSKEWRRLRALKLRQNGLHADVETQIYKKDGGLIEISLSISMLKNLNGKIIGAIGIMRDITNQKIAERKIKESENKIRIILDNSAAAMMLSDSQERIVSWNKFAEQLLGMKKKDLYLKSVSSLYPEEEWQKIRDANIRKVGSRHHLHTKIINKKGNIIDVDLSVNVLRDSEGKVTGSVGIMQDITEQKRFQEMLVQAKLSAEEANSAKSLFLANMSHEVRTPMNTIMGMIDLTLDTSMNEEQKDNLVVAKEAADNLLGLLNDILDLSRVEAGKITLENIEFNLHNVIRSVCKGLSVIARNKNLELVVDILPKVPEEILGDPVRLRQILINLINNAIKFTHKGKVTTQVKVASSLSEDEIVLLFSVIDEGIGIPKDRHEQVFEIFTQADDTTTRRFGGTGLGLAISKRLSEMMGGRIWVESEEGKGSTFSFTGTFKIVEVNKTGSTPSIGAGGENFDVDGFKEDLKGLRILLAEDNIVNQKIACRLLEKQGWIVTAVDNGQAVLDQIHKEPFDVVLMDAHMPILDGLEATNLIRENEKTTGNHIPIIALTARAMQEDRKKCIDAGMDGYVSKPIDRKKLFEEIWILLKDKMKK